MREGKGEEGVFLLSLALSLMMKVLGNRVMKVGIRYNNMDHMNQNC